MLFRSLDSYLRVSKTSFLLKKQSYLLLKRRITKQILLKEGNIEIFKENEEKEWLCKTMILIVSLRTSTRKAFQVILLYKSKLELYYVVKKWSIVG